MAPEYSQQTTPQQSPEQAPAQLPTDPPVQRPSRYKTLIICGALLLIGAAAAGLWFYNQSQGTHQTNDGIIAALKKPSLTAADLQGINKDDAFYAYLKYAAQQPKQTITKSFYISYDAGKKADDNYLKTAIDYQTNQITYAFESDEPSGGRDRLRCYGGQQYFYNSIIKEWAKDAEPTNCRQDKLYSSATDGFNAGGLTADQAEAFVSYLRGRPGLMTVKNMELATHAGKPYVHFTTALNQIESSGTHYAAQWLMLAFKKAGLDPDAHPFGYVGAADQGFDLEYYIDPATNLPAYSELTSIAPKDSAGNPVANATAYHYRVQYDFTSSTFDASQANNTNIAITW